MITETDAENLVKASQGASLLADDLRLLAQATNPFLAELAIEMLKATTELEQKLKRLTTAIKSA
ncbi:hypothetical protein NG726_11405 [Pseudomonas sp. MOB-449]|nr:hypothetical protein [Pseudomonas sp. MOB-449]